MSRYGKFSSLLLLIAITLALASCGGHHTKTPAKPPAKPSLSKLCPAGQSQMGCSVTPAPGGPPKGARGPSGLRFPDVSSFQGHPDWAAAKPFISMASVKAGEFVEDPDFAWNISQLKANGIKWAPYWFVRNTGCDHESAEIVSVIRSVGGLTSLPLVLDMEVPEAAGYAPCLANAVHSALGRWPIIYTAPGTWPGGSNAGLGLWVASYGPSSAPCFWTCHPLAWQYTDGRFGFPTRIPGISLGDVSVDYGFSKLVVDAHNYGWFISGKFSSQWGTLNERNVVKHYDGARIHPVKYHNYLNKLRAELKMLAGRDITVARRQQVHGKPSWDLYHRGWRYQQLIRRSQGKVVA